MERRNLDLDPSHARGFSGGAYFEPQLITSVGTFYTGIAAYGIDWPGSASYGFTSPSAEVDLYGGWRNSWGPLSLDLGLIYYYYPKETFNGFTSDSDFYEIYAKVGYDLGNGFSIGGNVFYTPDLLNYSETFTATGGQKAQATYASATAKWETPWSVNGIGSFISGEVGHWWIKDTGFIAAGVVDPSYTYYNVGLAFTYKALTLDLRYHGNDMGTTKCNAFLVVGPGNASSNWCNDTFIASLKFDTTGGFDTWIRQSAPAENWNIAGFNQLAMWVFGDNTHPWQGNQPVIELESATGTRRLTPNTQLMPNHAWALLAVPLAGEIGSRR